MPENLKPRYLVKFLEALNEYVILDRKVTTFIDGKEPILWEGCDLEAAMTACQKLNKAQGQKHRRGMYGERVYRPKENQNE